jgi:ATP-dependent RNA helicase DeaD
MPELSEVFLELPDPLQRGVRDLGWSEPTPVQQKVLPKMLAGRDLIVQAHTGSGKTGAFGLPIAAAVDPELDFCQALVLLPTRELANQVAEEVATLGRHKSVRCVPIYGGVGYAQQIEGIEAGAHVVVGTPGRILDHLGAGRLELDGVKILVFDEADELLSLGFWPDMREIASYLPKKRQSCLFSATIPERVRSLSRVFLNDPEFVSLSEGQLAPQEIEHFFVVTTAQEKDINLARILEYEEPDSAIIFCNTKSDVRYVTAFLQRRGFDADQISGDLTQAAREQAMASIKSGSLRFLVATDVAARGIDISDLSHVISYSTPDQAEQYLHRTGRTGRAGKTGTAVSLVSGLDIGNFRNLQAVNQLTIPERKIPSEPVVAEHVAQRIEVQLEHDLRHLSERERQARGEELLPVVEQLTRSEEGRRHLAAILFSYIHERRRPAQGSSKKPDAGADPAPADETAGEPEPRRRRRRRRR